MYKTPCFPFSFARHQCRLIEVRYAVPQAQISQLQDENDRLFRKVFPEQTHVRSLININYEADGNQNCCSSIVKQRPLVYRPRLPYICLQQHEGSALFWFDAVPSFELFDPQVGFLGFQQCCLLGVLRQTGSCFTKSPRSKKARNSQSNLPQTTAKLKSRRVNDASV